MVYVVGDVICVSLLCYRLKQSRRGTRCQHPLPHADTKTGMLAYTKTGMLAFSSCGCSTPQMFATIAILTKSEYMFMFKMIVIEIMMFDDYEVRE